MAVDYQMIVQTAQTWFSTDFVTRLLMTLGNLVISLVGFVIVALVGWFVAAQVVGHLLERVLRWAKFEELLSHHGVEDALGSAKVSSVLVKLTEYYVFLWFVAWGFTLFTPDLGPLSVTFSNLLSYAPVVIGSAVLVLLAALLGELVREKVMELGKFHFQGAVGSSLKVLVVFYGVVVALATLGFKTSIIETTFNTLLQGVVWGAGLAVGIAFGLGSQDTAKDWVGSWRKRVGW